MFDNLSDKLQSALQSIKGRKQLSAKNTADALRSVRRSLIEADVALDVIKRFMAQVEEKSVGIQVGDGLTPTQTFIKLVEQTLIEIMGGENQALDLKTQAPAVVMVVGLQGAGKTTSLAKLALFLKETEKKKVLLVSTDVYRPAAIEQLKRLSEQITVDFFASDPSQKPVKIAKAAKKHAVQNYYDVLLLDTAGRLHVDDDMMTEVKQLQKTIKPIETLFVIDAMAGQDAVNSASAFAKALPLTGIVLTKADADARGGVALSVRYVTGKAIKFLGVGEKVTALEPFHPERIVSRLLGMGDVLSLVEDINRRVDQDKAQKSFAKIQKGRFDFTDMKEQLLQMQNMGGMEKMMEKLPGMGQVPDAMKNKILDDKKTPHMVAIINAMTPKERIFVNLLNKPSRKKRIAMGSGTSIQQVNQVLKQFDKMQRMMKKMSGGKMAKMMKHLSQQPGGGDMSELMANMPSNMPKFPFK